MSNKQIKLLIDTVETFLTAQGRPAIVDDECRYRSDSGLMCGVGCLIPDDIYKKEFEGKVINTDELKPVVEYVAKTYKITQKLALSILSDIQSVHDTLACDSNTSFDLEELSNEFQALREEYIKPKV